VVLDDGRESMWEGEMSVVHCDVLDVEITMGDSILFQFLFINAVSDARTSRKVNGTI